MSGGPTSASSRPCITNYDVRPLSDWSNSEAPLMSHDPTSGARYLQQKRQRPSNQPHSHTQQESYTDDDDDLDDRVDFAYGPPPRADQSPQPHEMGFLRHRHPLYRPQHERSTDEKLHELVVAAGLSTSSPPLPPGLSSVSELSTAPNSHSPYAHNHHLQSDALSYKLEAGSDSYPISPIPASSGILEPQYTPAFDSTTNPNILGHQPVHIALATTMNSSMRLSAHLKRAPWDPSTSALEIDSRSFAGSPTSTQEDQEDSPYTEVRASVPNMDDPTMPTTTFRMWFLGLTLILGGSCLNTFLNFRFPAPFIMPSVMVLIAYPLGKALAYVLPTRTWAMPSILGGGKFTLNPGPFNVKEHLLIYMMANISVNPPYVMNAIVVAELYYGLDFGPGFAILLVLATTLTGFGLAGICRKFLVWPADMVWPQNLVSCILLNTLHEEDNTSQSRYRFFLYAITGILLWTFFPGLLFLGLSYFSWVCWMAPGEYRFSNFEDGATNNSTAQTTSSSTNCLGLYLDLVWGSSPSIGARSRISVRHSGCRGGPKCTCLRGLCWRIGLYYRSSITLT